MSIGLLPSSINALDIGQTLELEASVTPNDAIEEVLWFSDDGNIVTVQAITGTKGRKASIQAISAGSTRIYASNTKQSIKSQILSVTVNPPFVAITSISIPSSIDALAIDQAVEVVATVLPENAIEEVLWFSNDGDIVTVEAIAGTNGRRAIVTGISEGTTEIYATNPSQAIKSENLSVTVNGAGEWEDITSSVLTNYEMPFAHKEEAVFVQGAVSYYDIDGGWLYNAAPGANGIVCELLPYYDYTLVMHGAMQSFTNGKIYQRVTLDAGIYRFTAIVFAGWGTVAEAYVVAALNDLPDLDQIGNAIVSEPLPSTINNDLLADPYSIVFTLSESTTISLGFVANVSTGGDFHIRKVELWQLK